MDSQVTESFDSHNYFASKRACVHLSQVLHYLSDGEWAAEGSDDDLSMNKDPSYYSASSDEGIITPSQL